MLEPILYLALRCWRAWKYIRNNPGEQLIHFVGDCEWEGPGTDAGVDNDFYHQASRAKSAEQET